jgi:nitronate monooxygenase
MALDPLIRARIVLPAFCAPMFLVSNAAMLVEACKAGIIAGTNPRNSRSVEDFEAQMLAVRAALDAWAAEHPGARIGPLATNLNLRGTPAETKRYLDICRRARVDIVVTAAGDPTQLIQRVHDEGGVVWHDATSIRFAEKAIRAGADGIIAVGAGGGGHSGTVSHLALVPAIRAMFDGTIVMAGAVSNGAAIRAAEILGADLAYLGTRFIATRESGASQPYKDLLVSQGLGDLMYTPALGGVPANWLVASMRSVGLDPSELSRLEGHGTHHLSPSVRPWSTVWSAGQGISLIHDIPSIADLVLRLRSEYVAACTLPDMADVAALGGNSHGYRPG